MHYLRPGLPGQACRIDTALLRRGRALSTVRATLRQQGDARLEVLAAMGRLEDPGSAPLPLGIMGRQLVDGEPVLQKDKPSLLFLRKFKTGSFEVSARGQGQYPVKIDEVEPPLGFMMIQAANLVDWHSDRSDPRWAGFLNAVAAVARARGLTVNAHCTSSEGVKMCVRQGVQVQQIHRDDAPPWLNPFIEGGANLLTAQRTVPGADQ